MGEIGHKEIITPKTTLLLRWVWQIAVVAQNMAVYLQSLTGKSVQPLFTLKVKAVPYVLKLTCFHKQIQSTLKMTILRFTIILQIVGKCLQTSLLLPCKPKPTKAFARSKTPVKVLKKYLKKLIFIFNRQKTN